MGLSNNVLWSVALSILFWKVIKISVYKIGHIQIYYGLLMGLKLVYILNIRLVQMFMD